jgi:ABC-2 type transport system ATP-binding protein
VPENDLFSLLLDLIQPSTGSIINTVLVNASEDWKPLQLHLSMKALIGYLTPEEYFYFIGDLRRSKQG